MSKTIEILPLSAAAERKGVLREKIWNLVNAGRLPAIKQGPHWFVTTSDIDALDEEMLSKASGNRTPELMKKISSQILPIIKKQGFVTRQEIAESFDVSLQTAKNWLNYLSIDGLVEKKREVYRMPVKCYLTEAGEEALKKFI